uniref:ATP-dependent DNA helicase n=1 Tax=Lactuca sativa TaxID=4236 RepID=A0A9R1VPJ5_LACSA|nr:hypothetical protein LSAT_V11C400165000 [Lactuca sativa]
MFVIFDFRHSPGDSAVGWGCDNIRAYNSMFSMTSFGAKVDEEINRGRGPYVFKISGQVFHWIGSSCSEDSAKPRFLQLYMCDDENEVSNILCSFRTDCDVVLSAIHMLDNHNEYVCTFKTTKDMPESMSLDSYGVCLFNNVPDRRYGPPSPSTLGCIVFGDDVTGVVYDIVIYSKFGLAQRVSKLHPAYMYKNYQDALAICGFHGKPQYFINFTCNVRWPEYRRYMDVVGQGDIQNRLDIKARVLHIKVYIAELPYPASEVDLYRTVTTCMLHGPCGLLNLRAPCMQDMKCTKHFPKPFMESTTFDENGYVRYRRWSNINHVLHNGIIVDNGRSEGHCGGSTSVAPVAVNEIKSFLDGQYIRPHEAAWRILNFSIHERYPEVQVLPVHLEGMQPTIFKESARLDTLIDNPAFGSVGLTYNEYPSKYKWDTTAKAWVHRVVTVTSTSITIGRLAYEHLTAGELSCLRILLSHQKGCDEKEWLTAFHEAAVSASSLELRSLFCHLLIFCEVNTPMLLWESAKDKMGDDIHYAYMQASSTSQIIPDTNIIEQQVLLEIQKTLHGSKPSKSLADLGLPLPSSSVLAVLKNRLLLEEISYEKQSLVSQYAYMVSQLNPHQLKVHEYAVKALEDKRQILLFIRSQCFIVFGLHHNMRLSKTGISADYARRTSKFASWLLDIGDGKIETPEKQDPDNTTTIHIPDMFLINSKDQGLESLIDSVYGSHIVTNASPKELFVREISCPKNKTTKRFNTLILSKIQGHEIVYNNYDSIKSPSRDALDLDTLYPQDYLNNLDFSGVPTHRLVLKLNMPIMLLRNVNQREEMDRISNLYFGAPGKPLEIRMLRKWKPGSSLWTNM